MTDVIPILEYLCPACGNPYYGSSIGSYSIFDVQCFSDGSAWHDFSGYTWLTRCPKCKQFFSKSHLFHFPIDPDVAKFLRYSPPRRGMRDSNEKMYGNVDFCRESGESMRAFLEKAIEQGLYFPILTTPDKRAETYVMLYRDLWWEYNRTGDLYTDDEYVKHCERLIEMLLGREKTDETNLMLAELYRNVGDFANSELCLGRVMPKSDTLPYIACIRAQNKINNKKTERIIFK